MFAYFRYLSKVILKKPSLWCMVGISYIFILVLLIIIPVSLQISPLSVWNFDVVNIQSTFIIIDAVKSALLVVYAFRSDIEDGAELIIYSKPLRRIKILLSKFIWIIVGGLIFTVGYVLIALFTMCFGQYDPVNNVGGIVFSKVPALLASLVIGPLVVNLIFSSLGILVSKFGNKLHVIISVTMTSVAVSIYDIVVSMILNNNKKNIEAKYGGKINSFTSKTNDSLFQNYAYYDTQPKIDLYTAYKENPDTGNHVYQYLNISKQLSNFYKSFDLDDSSVAIETTGFGESVNYTSNISNQQNTLLKHLLDNYENFDKNSYPLLMPMRSSIYNDDTFENYGYMFLGINSSLLKWLRYMGASSDTVWVSNLTRIFAFVPTTYVIDSELLNVGKANIDEFDADVYNNIIYQVLSNLEYNQIKNTDKKDVSQATQTKFTELCFNFIKANSEKYSLHTDSLKSINTSFGILQYSMVRQFSLIYWSQIIEQISEKIGISATDYFSNTNNAFSDAFGAQIEITNPYDESAEAKINTNVDTFLKCFLAYSGAAQLNNTPTTITQQRFAYSNYGMSLEGKPLFDGKTPAEANNYYFMFPHSFVKTYNEAGFDVSTIFNYQTEQYYTRMSTSLFWGFVSILLFGISMYYYLRNDIY